MNETKKTKKDIVTMLDCINFVVLALWVRFIVRGSGACGCVPCTCDVKRAL